MAPFLAAAKEPAALRAFCEKANTEDLVRACIGGLAAVLFSHGHFEAMLVEEDAPLLPKRCKMHYYPGWNTSLANGHQFYGGTMVYPDLCNLPLLKELKPFADAVYKPGQGSLASFCSIFVDPSTTVLSFTHRQRIYACIYGAMHFTGMANLLDRAWEPGMYDMKFVQKYCEQFLDMWPAEYQAPVYCMSRLLAQRLTVTAVTVDDWGGQGMFGDWFGDAIPYDMSGW
eukprot:5411794-Prymnesium_polylepis.1